MVKNDSTNVSINYNLTYPESDEYEYKTYLKRLDMDAERIKDIKAGTGFIIHPPKGLKKDIKNQDGIFSSRFGTPSVMDADSFTNKYRCLCGEKTGRFQEGELCPSCKTRVLYRDDNISITGWIVTNEQYHLIHPNLYWAVAQFIGGSRLDRILCPDIRVNSDGNIINVTSNIVKKDEPFKGIGMMEFYNRFDEIIEFYYNRYCTSKPEKKIYYEDIKKYRNIIFTHSVAVFSSTLRPTIEDSNGGLKYEECNDNFAMINSLVGTLNKDKLKIDQKPKEINKILYDIQEQVNDLYAKIREMLAKKKGDIRSAIGGRFCFTSRSVIKQDVQLKADQVKLPFAGLCELLQQVIINILVKSYNISYADARKKWYKCKISNYDPVIYDIIQGLINSSGGLPVLINRNPTIARGGILSCKVVGINMDYTMSISLLVLKLLAADFDGDTLNIMYLYNNDFIRVADEVMSPRQMFISNNDGCCNADLLHSRDVIINANSLKNLYSYTDEEIAKIKRLQNIS